MTEADVSQDGDTRAGGFTLGEVAAEAAEESVAAERAAVGEFPDTGGVVDDDRAQ